MPRKTTSKPRSPSRRSAANAPNVLAIDIGGSSAKFLATGETKVRKIASGPKMEPQQLVDAIARRTSDWKYDVISLGYPGLVGASGPITEPANLGGGWVGFDFAAAFGKPLRIVNDATMQAVGSYDGGRMLFLGFGTGVGSVLIVDAVVVPLELGELKWKGKTFGEHFGRKALEKVGEEQWRSRLLETIPSLQRAFLVDYIVVGGGNSKYLLEPLPPNVRIGHNLTAFRGGYRLWGIDTQTAWQGDERPRATQSIGEWRLL